MDESLESLEAIISLSESSIEEFNKEYRYLMSMGMEEDDERGIHTHLLELIYEYKRKDLLEEFVKLLIETNPEEIIFPSKTYLLTLPIEKDCLEFYAANIDLIFYETAVGLIPVVDEDRIWRAVGHLDLIFKRTVPVGDIDAIVKKMEDDGDENVMFAEWLMELRIENSDEYAPVPEWIIFHPTSIKTHDELVAELKPAEYDTADHTLEEDFEYAVSIKNFTNEDVKAAKFELLRRLSKISERQRHALIRETKRNNAEMLLALEDEYFRVLGPCHMLPGAFDLSKDNEDICCRHGGCRSMTCYENENVDEYTGESIIENIVEKQAFREVEWFTGKCQNPRCALKIKEKHYAIRMPLEIGGFKGCYCKFSCARAMIDDRFITRIELLKRQEKMYNTLGIYDRRWT